MKEIPFVGFVFSMIQFPVGHLSFCYQSNKELGKNGAEKNGSLGKKIGCHGGGLEEGERRT